MGNWKDLTPTDRGCNPNWHGYMRNPSTLAILSCMWADCESYGLNRFHIDVAYGHGRDQQITHMVFCSPGHRALFVNSHNELGVKNRWIAELCPPSSRIRTSAGSR